MKHITLSEVIERAQLTQQEIEDATGVDRTRISKMAADPERANPTVDTYEKLVAGLTKLKALRRHEKLVFGTQAEVTR